MNSEQAKKLSLPDIMSRLGYEPTEITKGGAEYWYRSPFRHEKESSFHTSFLGGKWIWNDFADSGGTVIDFVMRHEGFSKVTEALQFLDGLYKGYSNTNRKAANPKSTYKTPEYPTEKQLEFLDATKIQHPAIIQYLTGARKINEPLARQYLKEIHYRNKTNAKEYFAFGIENRSGGYEIRSASDDYPFKSALITRDITIIPGFKTDHGVCNIFEGMTDFLSLLTMMKTDNLAGDSILMHSLSSFKKTVALIRLKDYQSIHIYLDNNQSGRECTKQFIQFFGAKIHDEAPLFMPFEDINDCLRG